MANTISPLDRESYHVQDSTSSHSVSPYTTTPASEVAPTRLTLKKYTARKKRQAAASEVAPKAKQLTLKEYIARKKQEPAAPQASTIPRNFKPHGPLSPRHGYEPCMDATQIPRIMAAIEEHSRRSSHSLLFRRKNDKLEAANRNATRTSTPRSKVQDELLLFATASVLPPMPPDSALKNDMTVFSPSDISDHSPEDRRMAPIPTKSSRHTPKNDMPVRTPTRISKHTLELEDDAIVPAATITTPVVTSDSPDLLFRLPRELRDFVYAYLAPDEAIWIARPPVVGKHVNAIVERDSMHKSAALIKSKHSLIFVSRDTRDEFRCALWRAYVDDSNRQVPLRVYDFDPKPISDLFTGCSPLDMSKLLEKEGYRVKMYLTGDLRRFREVPRLDPRSVIQTIIMRWIKFCDEIGFEPMYSFSKCTWLNMAVVDIAISQSDIDAGPKRWEKFQTNPHFVCLVPFFRMRFGRLLLGGDLDLIQQDRLIGTKWRF
jgi:hypothetical protein